MQTFTGQEIIRVDPGTSRGTLTLSDLVESVEYVPLETNDDCLMGEIKRSEHVLVSNNYILVGCVTSQSYYLFNRSGKFIAKIGNQGQGPSDYYRVRSPFAIDEEKKQVILSSSMSIDKQQLKYYDMKGKFLHSVSVDKGLTEFTHFQFEGKYVVTNPNYPWKKELDPPFNYSIYSKDYKLIKQEIATIHYSMTQRGGQSFPVLYCGYLYNGLLHVKNTTLNDTVYSINKNFTFSPKYIINAGKHAFTTQILSDQELNRRMLFSRAIIASVFETNKYVLISYMYDRKWYYQYYDKGLRKSMLFNSSSGIPNDYDGGLDFWPHQQNGNEFIGWYDAYKFEENENKTKPKGSGNALENLKKLNQKIDSESNPILVIVKMRQ
jgi:hypothetical protein